MPVLVPYLMLTLQLFYRSHGLAHDAPFERVPTYPVKAPATDTKESGGARSAVHERLRRSAVRYWCFADDAKPPTWRNESAYGHR